GEIAVVIHQGRLDGIAAFQEGNSRGEDQLVTRLGDTARDRCAGTGDCQVAPGQVEAAACLGEGQGDRRGWGGGDSAVGRRDRVDHRADGVYVDQDLNRRRQVTRRIAGLYPKAGTALG